LELEKWFSSDIAKRVPKLILIGAEMLGS